jgi:hypothetical protein
MHAGADEILKANHSLVLAKVHGYYEIKPLAENVCRLTFVAQGQMGGNVPNFAMTWAIKYDARPTPFTHPPNTTNWRALAYRTAGTPSTS